MTMKKPGRGPDDLRKRLIDAALRILEEPDTPLDLRKVAELAGKSRTAPYLVFGKESEGGGLLALRIAVAAEGARQMARLMDEAEGTTEDPLLAFRRVASAFLVFVRDNPRLFRLMYGPEIGVVSTLLPEDLKTHREFGELLHHRLQSERAIKRVIERCQASRLMPTGNTLRYTMIAWASMLGIAFLLLDEVLEAAGIKTDPEEAADLVTESVLGLDPERLEAAAGPFLEAQQKSEMGDVVRKLGAMPRWERAAKDEGPAEEVVEAVSAAEPPPPLLYAKLRVPVWRKELTRPEDIELTRTMSTYSGLRRAAQSKNVLEGARLLWIDDHPERNRAEIEVLRQFNAEVYTARTTAEAVALLQSRPFDVVVSDIAREGRVDEGTRALARLNQMAPGMPVVFYVARLEPGRGVPEGAAGITNSADELLHLVLDGLERGRG